MRRSRRHERVSSLETGSALCYFRDRRIGGQLVRRVVVHLPFSSHNWRSQALIGQIVSKLCGLAVGILAWTLTASPDTRLVRYSVTGACCTGFIGFLAGFLGPMIFTPHSNQGPLLGILFTGPFGFVARAQCGGALLRCDRRRSIPPASIFP